MIKFYESFARHHATGGLIYTLNIPGFENSTMDFRGNKRTFFVTPPGSFSAGCNHE
jgi:hypothetical protein